MKLMREVKMRKSIKEEPKVTCRHCLKEEAKFVSAKGFAADLLTYGSLGAIFSIGLMIIFIGYLTMPVALALIAISPFAYFFGKDKYICYNPECQKTWKGKPPETH